MADAPTRLHAELADRYRIEREIGAGGMATVYLAHDVRHDRRVALKVLRPELSAILGAERFLHEIRTTANLQHPHILGLHDSGEAGGHVYYVMPYVEGESLRDRLRREHQLPVEEAVRIAGEVLGALDYAHRHGVVHRDIKPENILLHDGSALVADFGIALAASRSDGGTRMTETGMSLGTPNYMSPEQAMGEREITPRVDVYAMGCVLYEMLTGEPPFTGPTPQAIVARVMTETPRSLTLQRHTVPPHVEGAVQVALEKLPADRFASAAQFAEALSKPGTIPATRVGAAATRPTRLTRPVLALAAATVASLGVATWALLEAPPEPPLVRYALELVGDAELNLTRRIRLSNDGARMAYTGSGRTPQIWLKSRSEVSPTPLAGTVGATSYAFSPDGEWLAFVQRGELRKIPVLGGGAITLADSASSLAGAVAWLDNGTIAYVRVGGRGIWLVPEDGGTRSELWRPDTVAATTLNNLSALAGGRGLLVARCSSLPCRAERDLWAVQVPSGAGQRVQGAALAGEYISTGHVLLVRGDGAMLALPFDASRVEVMGTPVPVLDSVSVVNEILPTFATSPNGTLVVRFGGGVIDRTEYTMVWMDRNGRESVVDPAWTFRHALAGGNAGWSLSPEGRRLAIGLNTEAGDDIWVKELPRGPLARVTFDPAEDVRPRWLSSGRSVVYTSFQSGALRIARADGGRGDSTLLDFEPNLWESTTTRDGLLVVRSGGTTGSAGERRMYTHRIGRDTALVPLITSDQFDAAAFALSPDEKWIAYESNETGRTEVYVRPFPMADAGKLPVSTQGGRSPVWSRNGRELFFVDTARAMNAVQVGPGLVPRLGERKVLFRLPLEIFFRDAENYTLFDVAADGRFLMARLVRLQEGRTLPLVVTENWLTELRARLR